MIFGSYYFRPARGGKTNEIAEKFDYKMKGLYMKRLISIILLLGLMMSLAACARTEMPDSSGGSSQIAESSSGTVSGSSVNSLGGAESSAGTESKGVSVPVVSIPNLPKEDIPEDVYGIHDLSTGNFIYNPNVTDTSNEARYYGDFVWKDEPKALWISSIEDKPWASYDADGAVAYGKAHWDDGVGLCAPFISRCITEGGKITEYTESSTAITLQLLHSRLGFGQFVPYNKSDHTVTLPSYARPGDVVQIYCSYEGVMIHSLLMVGTDENGKLRVVCHNYRNSGAYAFVVDSLNDPCYDCESETFEMFFYHFYRDDDEGLPEAVVKNRNIMLWEEKGYFMEEEYDREAALEYARNHPDDGLGYYGASHTSDILRAGGLSVGYPNQSALFLQLLKSHQGTAYSQNVRADRTVILPQYAKAGDIGFVYCPYDGTMISSFIISGSDDTSRMIALSYDMLNDGTSAFKVDSRCIGCGDDIKEVVIYCFDD